MCPRPVQSLHVKKSLGILKQGYLENKVKCNTLCNGLYYFKCSFGYFKFKLV